MADLRWSHSSSPDWWSLKGIVPSYRSLLLSQLSTPLSCGFRNGPIRGIPLEIPLELVFGDNMSRRKHRRRTRRVEMVYDRTSSGVERDCNEQSEVGRSSGIGFARRDASPVEGRCSIYRGAGLLITVGKTGGDVRLSG